MPGVPREPQPLQTPVQGQFPHLQPGAGPRLEERVDLLQPSARMEALARGPGLGPQHSWPLSRPPLWTQGSPMGFEALLHSPLLGTSPFPLLPAPLSLSPLSQPHPSPSLF